jgi:hypothetical protein
MTSCIEATLGVTRSTACPSGHVVGRMSWAKGSPPKSCPVAGCGEPLDWSPTRGLVPFTKAPR